MLGGFILLAPLVVGSLWFLRSVPFFERLEGITVDYRFKARAAYDKPAHPDLLLVGIDEVALKTFGQWPWDRSIHGDLCQLLGEAKPAAVAFDILFTEPGNPEADAHLAESAAALPGFVSGAKFEENGKAGPQSDIGITRPLENIVGDRSRVVGQEYAVTPIPEIASRTQFAFVNAPPTGDDGIRRRLPMVIRVGGLIYPSLALKSLMLYKGANPSEVEVILGEQIRINGSRGLLEIPVTERGEVLINYRNSDSYKFLSYAELMGELGRHFIEGAPLPENFPKVENSILVVGQTAEGLEDLGPNPLQPIAPLVLTSVNVINNVLMGDYLVEIKGWTPAAIWFLVSWITFFLLRKQSIMLAVYVPLLLALIYLAIAFVVFGLWSIQLPVAIPLLGFLMLHSGATVIRWIEEQIERQRVGAELAETNRLKALIERDLQIAHNIQMSMLPEERPPFPGRPEIDVFGSTEPAKSVGGDLYDYFFVDDDHLFVVVGDVAGKGIPAALFMAMALAVVRSNAQETMDPGEVLRRTNNALSVRNASCTFVTTFCYVLNIRTGELRYANGGHNGPLLVGPGRTPELLPEEGSALGLMEDLSYNSHTISLAPGDCLVIYTDGITEAFDPEDNMFEEERLLAVAAERTDEQSSEEFFGNIRERLRTFVNGAPQADDITAVLLTYRGSAT